MRPIQRRDHVRRARCVPLQRNDPTAQSFRNRVGVRNDAGHALYGKAIVEEAAQSNNQSVLVVEDEALVRLDIVDCLHDEGLSVLEAANADEAIEILKNRSDVRVVFTDVNMPGSMDGVRLAAVVRCRWPPIRLIVASGHMSVPVSALPPGSRFFRKPYVGPQVAETIAELLRN